jgi:hypothetical protein
MTPPAEPSTEEHRLPTQELRIPSGEPGFVDAGRRLKALEEAVRAHEQATSDGAVPKRPSDHALYHRFREAGNEDRYS